MTEEEKREHARDAVEAIRIDILRKQMPPGWFETDEQVRNRLVEYLCSLDDDACEREIRAWCDAEALAEAQREKRNARSRARSQAMRGLGLKRNRDGSWEMITAETAPFWQSLADDVEIGRPSVGNAVQCDAPVWVAKKFNVSVERVKRIAEET